MKENNLIEKYTPLMFSVAFDFVGIFDNEKNEFLKNEYGVYLSFNTFEECEIYINKHLAVA